MLRNGCGKKNATLCRRIAAPKIAAALALLITWLFACMTGLTISTLRAAISSTLLLAQVFISRPITIWQTWRIAWLVILCTEPHAIMQASTYLSFISVALLFIILNKNIKHAILQTLYIQLYCLVGILPLTLYWFSYAAINGFLVNLIAVPWVDLILPLCCLGLLILPFYHGILVAWPMQHSILILIKLLTVFDTYTRSLNLANININAFIFVLLMLSCFLCISLPIRTIGIAVFIAYYSCLYPTIPSIQYGQLKIDVLDVGQGLAVVLRTSHHNLLYDTGTKFYHGGDMAQFVIIPFLHHEHIQSLDTVVISHPDLDHRGGLDTIQKSFHLQQLLVNDPLFYQQGRNCHDLAPWQWDGVLFQFLPIKQHFNTRNNNGCVLKVTSLTQSILLPGDIEAPAERYLVLHYAHQLSATILIVPHHGSKTSSSIIFLKTVHPSIAIISAGFLNRFHFPHASTLAKLTAIHAKILNTSITGSAS